MGIDMNMHGFISPDQTVVKMSPARRAVDWILDHRIAFLIVVLPTLLVAAYLYLVAANQYETEAHFTIQSAGSSSSTPTSFGDFLGLSGAMSPSQSQAMGVADYLSSQEAVNTLRGKLHLVDRFRRPEADVFYRLKADPTPETLLKYYNTMVQVRYNRDTGISTLQVRAFRPKDAYEIISAMLVLGENRVNQLNQRAYNDAVASAQNQLADAEKGARDIERQMTSYRQSQGDINPTVSGQAQTTLVTTMTGNLATARAQLDLMGRMIGHGSPQYRAMQNRVAALQTQVGRQNGELTGGNGTIAARLGEYEDLKVRQEFAAKRFDAAASSLEKAKDQARRQSLYLVRIVDPSMPVKSTFPKRLHIVGTLLLTLAVAYSIGWMIVAGVREHAS
jgi:capsular polysaccharide transport system permease protein